VTLRFGNQAAQCKNVVAVTGNHPIAYCFGSFADHYTIRSFLSGQSAADDRKREN
jgi:hypothetical protein